MLYLSLFLSFFINTQPQPDQANFDWLEGTWAGVENTETEESFEVWEKLGKHNYKGVGYSLKNGDTTFVEQLSISNIYGELQYIADVPSNEEPVHFTMLKFKKTGFVCANGKNDFPKKIEYLLEDNVLKAKISGDGKSKTFSFVKQ